MSVSCDPGNYAKKFFFQSHFFEDGVYKLQCGASLDLLDADSSDSGSSGEKGDDI